MTRNRKWLWGLAAGAAVLAGALWLRRQRSGSPAPWEYPAPPDPLPGLGVPAESRYFDVNGISMHAVTAGEPGRPLVVLLHGFPESWYSWRHQIAPLVAAGFRVAAPDQRGYGRTAKAPPYSVGTLVEDVAGLIHALGYERAHVAGHDWGAAVAWACAVRHPDLVSRLAILNVPHPAVMQAALRGGNPRQIGRSWYMFFFQIPWVPEYALTAQDHWAIGRIFRATASREDAFRDEDVERYKRAAAQPGALTAAINYYRAAFRGRQALALLPAPIRCVAELLVGPIPYPVSAPKIEAPTLLIWGEDDPFLGKELTEGMEPLFKGRFETKYIAGCSHWVQQEEPRLVNQYILEFLADMRGLTHNNLESPDKVP